MEHALLQAVFLPLLLSPLAYIIGRKFGHTAATWFTFGVWGKKKFMGREYMGINRSTFLIDKKGKIFKVFEKVKPKGHSKEVLDAYINAEK